MTSGHAGRRLLPRGAPVKSWPYLLLPSKADLITLESKLELV